MRFLLKILVVVALVFGTTKLTEHFVLQPKLTTIIETALEDHKDKIIVKQAAFSGQNIDFSDVSFVGVDDEFSVSGYLEPVLFFPGVKFLLHPTGSRIWSIKQIEGKVNVWFNSVSAKHIFIQELKLLRQPEINIPEVLIQFDSHASDDFVDLNINVPQFGIKEGFGQLFVSGRLNPNDNYSGKLSLRVVNPGAVIAVVAESGLLPRQQISILKSLVTGLSNNKAEVTLPLSIDKGALYLGPIRLYPKLSREDNLARIGAGAISTLLRSFAGVPQ